MPSRADVSTVSRTASMPARWPSTRGRCRLAAQRPLPSMMIATCRGSRSKSTRRDQRLFGRSRRRRPRACRQGACGRSILARPWSGRRCRPRATRSQYRTDAASGRQAGAVGPAACADRGAEQRRAMDCGIGREPGADVGQRADDARTMWRRKPSPSTSTTISPAASRDVEPVNRPHGVADRRAARLERREVVPADERAAAARASPRVARLGRVPDEPAIERRQHRRRHDAIAVRLADGVIARVKARRARPRRRARGCRRAAAR